MILIIGGVAQGKRQYVANEYKGYEVIESYHEKIRMQLEQGEDPLASAKSLLADVKDVDHLVIICNEVGYGLVPIDAMERKYRETVGRVNCYLATEATEVVRVVAGMPMKIKG